MKKLINAPEMVVREMLEGLVAANKDRLKLVPGKKIILRKDCPIEGKVALLSGGGSGHEPDQGGFIGRGMLDARCTLLAVPGHCAFYYRVHSPASRFHASTV